MILLRINDFNENILFWFIYIIMVLSESAVATLITGSVGIVAVLISTFKCLVQCDGCCKIKSFEFGFLDNAVV